MDLLYYSLQSCKWGRLCHQYIIDARFIRDHLCTIMDLRPKHTLSSEGSDKLKKYQRKPVEIENKN